jgi:hypothetical protein
MFQIEVLEKIKTHILCAVALRKSYRLLDNVEKYGLAREATDDHMAYAHCMPVSKATNTHSEYVILVGLPLQKLLHEHASTFRYTYSASLVKVYGI